MSKPIPEAFASLSPFTKWALPTETLRNQVRMKTQFAEATEYADAILPLVPSICEHLDAKQAAGGHDEADLNLFYMLLSLAELAPAIESYNPQTAVVDGYESARFPAVETHRLRPAI